MPPRRVTLKDIGQALGLSAQTISLSLRDSRKIPVSTRRRVRAKADEMGYEVDASLTALSRYRTGQNLAATRWNRVALLHNWPTKQALLADTFYAAWFHSLLEAAAAKGVAVEEHWLDEERSNTKEVFRKLRARGITGVFLAPPSQTLDPKAIEVPKTQFQFVTFGPEHLYPDLHTIQFDYYENMRQAWSVLWARGYRRIGLAYPKHHGVRTDYAWLGAFHVAKMLAGYSANELPPLELNDADNAANQTAYRRWAKETNLDAVITSHGALDNWDSGLCPPPVIAMLNPIHADQQGIHINVELMTATAVEILLLEMQRSLITTANQPLRIHIPGKWVDRKPGV